MFITTYMNRRVHRRNPAVPVSRPWSRARLRRPKVGAEKIRLAGFERCDDAVVLRRPAGCSARGPESSSPRWRVVRHPRRVWSPTFDMANSSIISACAAHLREVPVVLVAGQVIYTRQNPLRPAPSAGGLDAQDGCRPQRRSSRSSRSTASTLATNAWVDKNGGTAHAQIRRDPFSATRLRSSHTASTPALMVELQFSTSLAGHDEDARGCDEAIAPTFMFGCYTAEKTWAAQPRHTKFVRS